MVMRRREVWLERGLFAVTDETETGVQGEPSHLGTLACRLASQYTSLPPITR
uniref:Uncharacterized protein n=1 Tax=Anguilla anguilla TaxID=7936 RepID=A0A0E9ULW3_ANGAN